jgi:4-alpha-glucanotransferase
MDVQRWSRDWGRTYDFKPPEAYRENSVAVISTHDMVSFAGWWEGETGTVDEHDLKLRCQSRGLDFEAVKGRLFDPGKSRHGRLRWKKEITENEAGEFQELWRSSFPEKQKFWDYVGLRGACEEACSPKLVRAALAALGRSASIFSIQLLQDWLGLGVRFPGDPWEFRINVPGLVSPKNWSLVLPVSLEEMLALPLNVEIRALNGETGRI